MGYKINVAKRWRVAILLSILFAFPIVGNSADTDGTHSLFSQPGIIGTFVLAGIAIMVACVIVVVKLNGLIKILYRKHGRSSFARLKNEILNLDNTQIDELLKKRGRALEFRLTGEELSGNDRPDDFRGLIRNISTEEHAPLVEEKKIPKMFKATDHEFSRLIIAFLAASSFWLLFGTTVGQYLGMKFIWPEIDTISWLSFGRLRPVHTNTVFWGWASMAMIGLGYFVVARTSNTRIYNISWGWLSWWLLNLSVVAGNTLLLAGVNNGGGEYREYIWPVAVVFASALLITTVNFYKTIAGRKSSEIYISNWYIMAGCLWTLVLVTIAYLPFYQDGLGETIIQGYYMHQAVGMWFMTFTLGLVYYYLPTALNKPIYSYSLGILAFWTQMLFYTMIGTHHFIFSPLPWWLQTIAIVFSVGMFIPVISGTTNFLMTIKGSWSSVRYSYVMPFLLVGVLFYFVGSTQGSVQAFRFTNYVWHFTDFNVAHSHMTMYGIISFFLWGCIYFILPQLTRTQPNQVLVGIHFWFALIGLFAYMFSLMIGGTLKGMSWIADNPFVDSVKLMMPYWVWRAIGGTLMLLSHIIFVVNLCKMIRGFKHGLVRKEVQPKTMKEWT
ncbi:MAG TPA: cbb3-type cytochrome c oxidase subunit I [Cyclobacteriaceae bacterium]|nr:cbb3-type cytochrome c oxidase subunit I [Cyclobacteriaceae bacterium]